MRNRLIINILLGFAFIPLIVGIRDYIELDILHDSSKFYGTFSKYLSFMYWQYFVIMPSLFVAIILLPYNLVIIKLSKTRQLTLVTKILIFQMIISMLYLLLGTYVGLMGLSFWFIMSNLIYLIPLSIFFATLIHILVDRKSLTIIKQG